MMSPQNLHFELAGARGVLFRGLFLSMVLGLVFQVGCRTSYRKARPDLPKDERGAAELSALLYDFKAAVSDERFEVAFAMLDELEHGVENADPATASHPDFTDIAKMTAQARPALEAVVRKHQIADLGKRTTASLTHAKEVAAKLDRGRATEELLDELDGAIEELDDLAREGNGFRDDEAYGQFALHLDREIGELANLADRAHWAFATTRALDEVLSEIVRPSEKATLAERIDVEESNAEAFGECIEVCERGATEDGHSSAAELPTREGKLTLSGVLSMCENNRRSARNTLARLRWRRGVEGTLARIDGLLASVAERKDPKHQLQTTREAAQQLADECDALRKSTRSEVADRSFRFESGLGGSSLSGLLDACNREKDRLVELRPTLEWRVEVSELQSRAEDAVQQAAELQSARGQQQRRRAAAVAIGGYRECVERAAALLELDKGKWRRAQPSRAERREVEGLHQTCSSSAERLTRSIKKARRTSHQRVRQGRRVASVGRGRRQM